MGWGKASIQEEGDWKEVTEGGTVLRKGTTGRGSGQRWE